LSNLVVNAIKFTPPQGRVELDAEADGQAVRFSVRDTGPGIPPDLLPRVFERFWKGGGAGRAGTGLGLNIAREIVEAHGGRIWVESQPDHGTTFHFTLPAAVASATLPPQVPARGTAHPAARLSSSQES
jgi:signal transduction histidine kinase